MIARIQAESTGAWHDPHNNGTYSLVSHSASQVDTTRLTGDKKYTDKQTFSFSEGSGSCTISACSESQVSDFQFHARGSRDSLCAP